MTACISPIAGGPVYCVAASEYRYDQRLSHDPITKAVMWQPSPIQRPALIQQRGSFLKSLFTAWPVNHDRQQSCHRDVKWRWTPAQGCHTFQVSDEK